MDNIQIATAITAWLSPFLPYLYELLKTGGNKFIEFIAEKGGESAWTAAQKIWDKINNTPPQNEEVKGAMMIVAANPSNLEYQAILAKALIKQFNKRPSLAKEFVRHFNNNIHFQEILANNKSLVEKVSQNMSGTGRQSIKAINRSTVRNVTQIQNKRK
jgi:hypothetical protein